jgi:hypothetical protein
MHFPILGTPFGCLRCNRLQLWIWFQGFTPASTTSTDLLAANGLLNLAINQIENAFSGKQQGSCNLANAAVRREW